MIRRFVTMSESIDIGAGVKSILKRIEATKIKRPEQVKFTYAQINLIKND